MPLYPLPAIVAIVGWGAIFLSTGSTEVRGVHVDLRLAALALMAMGTGVFLVRAKVQREWPFATTDELR